MGKKVKFVMKNPEKVWFRNLQKAREAKGWTQVKLATEIEISQQSITYYETGTRIPSLEVAEKLGKTLGVTIDYLLGNDDEFTKAYYNLDKSNQETIMLIIDKLNKKENIESNND